jgi:AraC-like DNA-binding protein
MLTVTACNVNYPHDMNYTLNRPHGFGKTWVFIHCLTLCEFRTESGIEWAKPGACLIYAPDCPQWNKGHEEPLRNNWLHWEGEGAGNLLKDYHIPCNQLFYPEETAFIEPMLGEMRRELYERRWRWEESLTERLKLFFIELARQCGERKVLKLSATEVQHIYKFRSLRAAVMESFAEPWTVSEMAERVHLSRSRFSVLYKKIFGIAPLEDLLSMRLLQAKALLNDPHLTIEAVARICGFESAIHFHRIFRKRCGCTPREYAQIKLSDKEKGNSLRHHR